MPKAPLLDCAPSRVLLSVTCVTSMKRLYLARPHPLALGSIQALAVPGRCRIGEAELELYPTEGHTADGMAVWVPWARVLVAGDYLSALELPTLRGDDWVDRLSRHA